MSHFRALSASALSAIVTFGIVTASGCGTAAVGIEDCRRIEHARCRAGAACGIVTDVEACLRYYRGHCLHGLPTEPPGDASVGACVSAIEAAGRCASSDPDARLSDCDEDVPAPRRGLTLACDVVAHPERAAPCAFLLTTPPVEEPGNGGASGAGADEPAGGGQAAQGGAPAD